jgi:hypothetical protein
VDSNSHTAAIGIDCNPVTLPETLQIAHVSPPSRFGRSRQSKAAFSGEMSAVESGRPPTWACVAESAHPAYSANDSASRLRAK